MIFTRGNHITDEDNKTSDNTESPQNNERKPTQEKKLDLELTTLEPKNGVRPGDAYIRVKRPKFFRLVRPGQFISTTGSDVPTGALQRAYYYFSHFILGRSLLTAEEVHQRLSKVKALAVFGSDAISSSAYATEAAIVVLMAARSTALGFSFYTSIAIAVLLSIVAFSYRQTVHAYPQGGGTYNVSSKNLGQFPGLIAAAALLVDYILTVSVSIVAGARAITSALAVSGYGQPVEAVGSSLPSHPTLTVLISLLFIGILILGNLRGIRESGTIFSLPTYFFIFGMVAMLAIGLIKSFTGNLHAATPPPHAACY